MSEIQTKPCLAWFIARDTVPHTTAHRYIIQGVGVSDEFDGANWWRGGLGFASDLARF